MKRVVSLSIFLLIMVLYILIQIYWGLNLYRAFVNEEKKEIGDLLSTVITSYAGTILSESADDPDNPVFTMEPISHDNDSVLSNAIVTEVLEKPEELTGVLEKVLIVASIRTDSLFLERLAYTLEQKLIDREVYSFDLYLSVNGAMTNSVSSTLMNRANAFNSITIQVEKEFEVEGDTYVIGSAQKIKVPTSLRILAILFVVGILLLVSILYLLIRMAKKVELEIVTNRQQELFFYGLVHDLKLPLSLAHSLIDGLISNVDATQKAHSGLIEADNHILKLTDDINMLLTIHRLKQNKQTRYRRLYLYDVVQDITIELEAHYPQKEITFFIDFPNDLMILFPAEELKLVLRVFLDNAVKYSNGAPKVTIQATSDENAVSIMIKDNGSSIELFKNQCPYDLDPSWIRKICKDSNGGIGLIVAWTILHSKSGKITYSKVQPTGSLFTLTIPKEKQ